jgi:hypothetical protein
MAHIQRREFTSKRTGKQEVRWQARYRAPDGRERARRFRRKADAEDWLAANTVQLGDGTWTDPRAGRILLVDYARDWYATLRRADSTMANIGDRRRGIGPGEELGRVIGPLGHLELRTIRPAGIRRWVADLTDEIATSTVRSYYWTLHQLPESAVVTTAAPPVSAGRCSHATDTFDASSASRQGVPPRHHAPFSG